MKAFDPRQILLENDQIMVVYKPSGTAVQSGSVGQMDLEHQLLGYLASKGNGREIPYLAVIHRLDQPVEGLLLFAKTKEAAADCSRQLQNGTIKKEYLAVVRPAPKEREAVLTDYLLQDRKTNSSRTVKKGTPGAKEARLQYRVLEKDEQGQALLGIQLMTGRHHQIRVQLSHADMPIIGDRKYGGASSVSDAGKQSEPVTGELLLCAAALTFRNPATGETERIEISPRNRGFQNFRQVRV